MKRKLLIVAALYLAALITAPNTSLAQGQSKTAPETKAPATPGKTAETTTKTVDPDRKLPFHGKVVAVDKTAKTIKISSRTFKVMPDTQITKYEKPATLNDAVIGEVTGGSYKNNNGTLELVKLRLGPKAEDIVKNAPTKAPAVAKTEKPATTK